MSRQLVLRGAITAVLLTVVFGLGPGSEAARAAPVDLDTSEVIRRIFEGERTTLEQLKGYSPEFEVYVQSLWPDTGAQVPLDDAQFVGRLDFADFMSFEPESVRMLFGASGGEAKILNDNGQRWSLSAKGFLSMLFVDRNDFDADTYQLTPTGRSAIDGINCLRFDVAPIKANAHERFRGTIWVEPTDLRIIRIQGQVQRPHVGWLSRMNPVGGRFGIYFKFDARREKIAHDLWAPASVVIDDNRSWKSLDRNATTDIHYRAVTLLWGYSNRGSFESRRRGISLGEVAKNPVILGLAADGIMAPKGPVEEHLDGIVSGLQRPDASGAPTVSCRVILTTNAELFHIGKTIIISRGLLALVPDDEILTALLAHEVSHIERDDQQEPQLTYDRSLFGRGRMDDFGVLGIRTGGSIEGEAADLTCGILARSHQQAASNRAAAFLKALAATAPQIPHLAGARLGLGLIDNGTGAHFLRPCTPAKTDPYSSPLVLSGRFSVDPLNGRLSASVRSVEQPSEAHATGGEK